jgi:hypothetical protein
MRDVQSAAQPDTGSQERVGRVKGWMKRTAGALLLLLAVAAGARVIFALLMPLLSLLVYGLLLIGIYALVLGFFRRL